MKAAVKSSRIGIPPGIADAQHMAEVLRNPALGAGEVQQDPLRARASYYRAQQLKPWPRPALALSDGALDSM